MSHAIVNKADTRPAGAGPVRVMIVDDSAVIRGVIARWNAADAGLAVAASVSNGRAAVDQIKAVDPDVVVLDIEMPEMDGITALPLLLKACPKAKIIMASTLTRRNAEISIKALSLGATDYVPKPTSVGAGDAAEAFRRDLCDKINALGRLMNQLTQALGEQHPQLQRLRRSIQRQEALRR